jgi:alginate O-acetyltransferase complex protein AlgI
MMGFRFIENFNMPYLSRSITEFWRRWHISLSTWLRDYLYIPLGGSRNGQMRTTLNLFLTMLLGGLWHGANWTFVLWGAWHGILLLGERVGTKLKWPKTASPLLSHLYCLFAVLIGWVMFRSPDVRTAFDFYTGLSGINGVGLTDSLFLQIKDVGLCALAGGVTLIFVQPLLVRWRTPVLLSKGRFAAKTTPPLYAQVVVSLFFLLAVTRLIAMSTTPFLYFQF